MLGIVVAAAVAVAAFGIYLLVLGSIALVGWLITLVLRREPTRAAPALAAPPPEAPYSALVPVDPAVFDDPAGAEAAAREVFSAWASRLPRAPADVTGLVRNVELGSRLIGRMTSRLDGRRFVWRSAPYAGREPASGTPIDPAALDPYNPPPNLRARSRSIVLCESCRGDGRITCTACSGSGRTVCPGCHGAGKLPGVTANGARRLLNCKTCKGKTTLTCSTCSRGELVCARCGRSGRVEHWLEVEGGERDGDINVEPDGELTRAFAWGKDGTAATTSELARDARVLCEVRAESTLAPADLPAVVPSAWVDAHWNRLQGNVRPGERVLAQELTLLEVPMAAVTYGLPGAPSQTIELHGLRLLAPPIQHDTILHARASSLDRLALALAILPIGAAVAYAVRGAYFARPAVVGVVACTALAAALVYVVVAQASLGRRGARRWLVAALAPMALGTGLAVAAEPSVERTAALLDAGRVAEARAALSALGKRAGTGALWDRIHLQEVHEAEDSREAADAADRLLREAERAQADARVDTLRLAEAEAALREGRLDVVRARVDALTGERAYSPAAERLRGELALVAARDCLQRQKWRCALERTGAATGPQAASVRADALAGLRAEADELLALAGREKDLRARVDLQTRAEAAWAERLSLEPGPEPPALLALRKRYALDAAALAKHEGQARQRAAAEERRRAAAEERERRRQAAGEEREQRRQAAAALRVERAAERTCCKYCSTGCACGDSCISCSKTCRKGPGCACD